MCGGVVCVCAVSHIVVHLSKQTHNPPCRGFQKQSTPLSAPALNCEQSLPGLLSIAAEIRNKPSSKMCVTLGRQGCQASGKAGMGSGALPRPTDSCSRQDPRVGMPAGARILSPDAYVYPGWAGWTWILSCLPGNLDSYPWTATKALPSRRRWSAVHAVVALMPQVSNLVSRCSLPNGHLSPYIIVIFHLDSCFAMLF